MVDKTCKKKHLLFAPQLIKWHFIHIFTAVQYEDPCRPIPTDDAWCGWISELLWGSRWQQAGSSKHPPKKKSSWYQQQTCTSWGHQIRIKLYWKSLCAILVHKGRLIKLYMQIHPSWHYSNTMPSSAYQKSINWLRQVVHNETLKMQSEWYLKTWHWIYARNDLNAFQSVNLIYLMSLNVVCLLNFFFFFLQTWYKYILE